MKKTEVHWGQEFLPEYPDGYITETITPDGHCPCCGRKVMRIHGEAYCPSCYMANRKKYGKTLTEDETELVLTLMTDQWLDSIKKNSIFRTND